MQEEHLWMRRMTYNICVQCPVCSKGGVQASECDIHHVAGCKRDQCLHYITEDEIVGDRDLVCCQSDDAMNRDISREQFKPWFEALDSKVCAPFVFLSLHLLHTNDQTRLHFENHGAHIRISKHLLHLSSKQVLFYCSTVTNPWPHVTVTVVIY